MNNIYAGALSRPNFWSVFATVVVIVGLVLSPPSLVSAHKFEAETVIIDHPYSFPTPPGIKTGGVYFDSVTALQDSGDKLISASSPAAARVEIHRMRMDGNVMRMREVDDVPIKRVDPLPFHKGAHDGYHLMLMELHTPLTDGMSVPLTLQFERAGAVEVEVKVVPFGSHSKQSNMDPVDHGKHKH